MKATRGIKKLALCAVAGATLLGLVEAAAANVPHAPPRPLVIADGGAQRHAAAGSYCWSYGRHGICADSIDPITYAPKLRVLTGSELTIRMGFPATSLVAVDGDGKRLQVARRLGSRGRGFGLTLPAEWPGESLDLYLQADYRRGDALFAVRLKQRPR